MRKIGIEADETAIVGDRRTDIAMASAAEITGILVLSGETKRSDLDGSRSSRPGGPGIRDLINML